MSCPLCNEIKNGNLLIRKIKGFAITFNKYPYVFGHLMIIPLEHKANLEYLNEDEQTTLMKLINKTQLALKKAMNTTSINIGMNMGLDGGGSVPQHLHVHILPRRDGDFNFTILLNNLKPLKQMDSNANKIEKIIEAINDIEIN